VAANDEPALEAEEQILADGLDRFEHPTVDCLGNAGGLRARVRRHRLNPLAYEWLQLARGAMERVALGHAPRLDG
jgi:hypothetical protein